MSKRQGEGDESLPSQPVNPYNNNNKKARSEPSGDDHDGGTFAVEKPRSGFIRISNDDTICNSIGVPIHICEDHSSVLPHIYATLRSLLSCLPPSDRPSANLHFTMVHFDSHPDLSILPTLTRSDLKDVHSLQHKLDNHPDGISSWITPLILQNHLSTVHWIHQMLHKN